MLNKERFEEKYVGKIHCADCLELMKDWPDGCVDLVVTSPPYDKLRNYKGYSFDFESIAKQLFRIIKIGSVVVWVVGDATVNGTETGTSFKQALYFMKIGFNLHDTMIYQKQFYVPLTHHRYEQEFEYMFVFTKGKLKTFNPIMIKTTLGGKKSTLTHRKTGEKPIKGTNYGELRKEKRIIGNVWRIQPSRGSEHPAVFPEELAVNHIKSWSNEGDIVIDPMCGSGTTPKMASNLGRRYIGIDISEEYCQIARDRLRAVDTGVPVKEARAGQGALFND